MEIIAPITNNNKFVIKNYRKKKIESYIEKVKNFIFNPLFFLALAADIRVFYKYGSFILQLYADEMNAYIFQKAKHIYIITQAPSLE